jgi:hypothetical protein
VCVCEMYKYLLKKNVQILVKLYSKFFMMITVFLRNDSEVFFLLKINGIHSFIQIDRVYCCINTHSKLIKK